jgi:hypothetical protein
VGGLTPVFTGDVEKLLKTYKGEASIEFLNGNSERSLA